MFQILRFFSFSALIFIVSYAAFADASKTALSSASIAKKFLIFELSSKLCPSKASSPFSDKSAAIISKVKPLLFAALTVRAKKIHPDVAVENLSTMVRDWYGNQMKKGGTRLSEERICNLMPVKYWEGMIEDFSIDGFADEMRMFENVPITYKSKIPLVDGSSMKSFALQDFQRIILSTIAGHAKNSDCGKISVTSIELNEERDAKAANLPPFIASPVRYKETWTTMCGKRKQSHLVTFIRDSESMKGAYTIKSQ